MCTEKICTLRKCNAHCVSVQLSGVLLKALDRVLQIGGQQLLVRR